MSLLALPAELQALANAQGGAFTADQAREHGFDVARPRRAGQLTVIRKQVYACTRSRQAMPASQLAAQNLSARLLVSRGDLVGSHATAAAVHGFTLLHPAPAEPQLTQARADLQVCRRPGVTVSDLPAAHRCLRWGVAVTTPPRTLADCARTLTAEAALVTADHALRSGVGRVEVLAVLTSCARWPGVRQAQAVLRFADARSDSALESRTRWQFAQQGLPAPDLQLTICDADGRDVGEVDFVWLAHRTICETDGRVKYTGGPEVLGRDNALWREKLREDALRALGFEVVRGYWRDLADGGVGLAARVRAAFALNAVRSDLPPYCYRERPVRLAQRAQ